MISRVISGIEGEKKQATRPPSVTGAVHIWRTLLWQLVDCQHQLTQRRLQQGLEDLGGTLFEL